MELLVISPKPWPSTGTLPVPTTTWGSYDMAQGDGEKAIQHFVQGSGDGSATLRSPQQSRDTLVGKWAAREGHLAYFTRSLLLKPNQARAHNNLGAALDLQGHSEEAIDSLSPRSGTGSLLLSNPQQPGKDVHGKG